MKNLVLIDFTFKSMRLILDYAIGFCQTTKSDLKLINRASKDIKRWNLKRLEHLKREKKAENFNIEIHEMVGDIENTIPD